MTDTTKKRPEFRNINPLSDLTTYRLPLAGKLSILHRVSGLPFVIWLLDTSISSEFSYARFTAAFNTGAGIFPGWFIKLAVLALIWSYLHHFCAGLRHIWMDVSHKAVNKEFGKNSALACFVISLALTAILGAKLFGLY